MQVYCILGVPPEIQAYAMARYSRSSQSMRESIQELSAQKAQAFLNTYYFQYGHRSIADLAHLVIALEQISILAAVEVVDEPLWDGQERSTRYQNFSKTGYYHPPEVMASPLAGEYIATCDFLFDRYDHLSQALSKHLTASYPCPPGMDRQQYQRTIRARALDVARYLLPLATLTSVGQVVSARVLERQITRLLSDCRPELRAIGAALRQACLEPAHHPVAEHLRQVLKELADGGDAPGLGQAVKELELLTQPTAAAPTLVKYTQPIDYLQQGYPELAEAAGHYLQLLHEVDRSKAVELADPEPPLDELVATLLYRVDPEGHSYRQIQQVVRGLSPSQKRELLALSFRHRGSHDELLREHRSGYALKFDILMDFGSFRDLHRHRRCVQIHQGLTLAHGYDPPEAIWRGGLGEEAGELALQTGLDRDYRAALDRAAVVMGALQPHLSHSALYLMPMAFRKRTLFKMDVAQAAYMIELRSGAAGHFSYRQIALQMHEELKRWDAAIASHIQVGCTQGAADLLTR